MATTSLREVNFDGVILSSRYDKADEYETMLDMIEGVSPVLRKKIKSVFCDSKATHCYAVELNPCTKLEAKAIGNQLDTACMDSAGWHNGIFLNGSAGGSLFLAAGFDFDDV